MDFVFLSSKTLNLHTKPIAGIAVTGLLMMIFVFACEAEEPNTPTPVPTATPQPKVKTVEPEPTKLPTLPETTDTPIAPTDTPVPPTETPIPPTNTPEPTSTNTPVQPTKILTVHGGTETVKWWCEIQYCYKTTRYLPPPSPNYTPTTPDEECFQVERIPVFEAEYPTIEEKLELIDELIAQGQSTPCTRPRPY